MKALRSRILSIALAASLLLSSGMIAAPLSAGATGAGEIPVLDPMVADGDVSNQFFAWDSGNVAVGAKVTLLSKEIHTHGHHRRSDEDTGAVL